jgi:hypothetical protein
MGFLRENCSSVLPSTTGMLWRVGIYLSTCSYPVQAEEVLSERRQSIIQQSSLEG